MPFLVLLLIKISGLLPKTSPITSVNLPFPLLSVLIVLLLTLLLKRLISLVFFFHLIPPWMVPAPLLLLHPFSGVQCLYLSLLMIGYMRFSDQSTSGRPVAQIAFR